MVVLKHLYLSGRDYGQVIIIATNAIYVSNDTPATPRFLTEVCSSAFPGTSFHGGGDGAAAPRTGSASYVIGNRNKAAKSLVR